MPAVDRDAHLHLVNSVLEPKGDEICREAELGIQKGAHLHETGVWMNVKYGQNQI
jgi:hypothetical protein